MRTTQLLAMDLNLLVPLRVLLEERSVSAAAAQLHLSQPATSRALQRLRAAFDDELLIRGAGGYLLTPRARELEIELSDLLPRIASVYREDGFDPATHAATVQIVGTDFAAAVIGVPLTTALAHDAPEVQLTWRAWKQDLFDELRRGTADLVFRATSAPAALRSAELFQDDFVCLVDEGHPLTRLSAVGLADYLAHPHVIIAVEDRNDMIIDRRLNALGHRRTPGAILPYYLPALELTRGTRLIATVPRRLLHLDRPPEGVTILPAPAELGKLHYAMAWHPRTDRDPFHIWLRALVQQLG